MKVESKEMRWAALALLLTAVTATNTILLAQTDTTSTSNSVAIQPINAPTYELGPGDQLIIQAFELPVISGTPFRVDTEGFLNLPVLGRIMAKGLTSEQLESNLVEIILAKQLVNTPQVTVTLTQFRQEPVFLTGAFQSPGAYPVQSFTSLSDLILSNGGLQPGASRRIKILRRLEFGAIPLPQATIDPDRNLSVAEIDFVDITETLNSSEDLVLMPFDVISANPSEMVYVQGEMGTVKGFPLEGRRVITISQLISMAGGPEQFARLERAVVMRPVAGTPRRAAIPVNLKRITNGRDRDFPLQANDVLYVPRSRSKAFWGRFWYVAIPATLGAVYAVVRN